jgi:hypothetical protein
VNKIVEQSVDVTRTILWNIVYSDSFVFELNFIAMKKVAAGWVLLLGMLLFAPQVGFSQKSEDKVATASVDEVREDLPLSTVQWVLQNAAVRHGVSFEHLMQLWVEGKVVIIDIGSGGRFTNCKDCLDGVVIEVLIDLL